jgi:hypothetical protein
MRIVVTCSACIVAVFGTSCMPTLSENIDCAELDEELLCETPSPPECYFSRGGWSVRECSWRRGCLTWNYLDGCDSYERCAEENGSAGCVCDTTSSDSCYYEWLRHGVHSFSTCLTAEEYAICDLVADQCPVWKRYECTARGGCIEDEDGAHCQPPIDCGDQCPADSFGECLGVGEKSCDFSDEPKKTLICQQQTTYTFCSCWAELMDCGDLRCLWSYDEGQDQYVPVCR